MTGEMSGSSVVLPFQSSLFNAWPDYSFLSCVITQKEKGLDWLINNLVLTKGILWGSFGDISAPRLGIGYCPVGSPFRSNSVFKYCPFVKTYTLPKSFIRTNYASIADYLSEALENGYYVWLLVDQFFSPARKGKTGRAHPVYVYGVDKTTKQFYIADNFYNGRFGVMQVEANILNRAFVLMDQVAAYQKHYDDIIIFNIVDYEYSFDSGLLADLMRDYLNADGRYDSATRLIDAEHNQYVYGIDCYTQMRQYTEQLAKWPHYLGDIRSLCFLQDHAEFMKLRIDYLLRHHYITDTNISSEVFSENAKSMKKAVNLFLKYYMTKNTALLRQICDLIDGVKAREQVALRKVVLCINVDD